MNKKGLLSVIVIALSMTTIASCSSKKSVLAPAVQSSISKQTTVEGVKVNVETVKLQGIEMSEALSEDGSSVVKVAYKWFAGIGKADDKQVAIELAQREAYAIISRIFSNLVKDEAERGNVANNGRVQQALTTHWEQFSTSLQKGCEPFGNTTIEYDQSTRLYNVTAKVGIRGDRFNELLNTAGNFRPSDLTGAELDEFIEINKSIMNAAKGN